MWTIWEVPRRSIPLITSPSAISLVFLFYTVPRFNEIFGQLEFMSVICLDLFNSTLLRFFVFFFPVEHPKPVRLSPSSTAKRTGSLDTIAGPYLTGHWPRCDVTVCNPLLAAQPQDKATQVSRLLRESALK